MAVVTITEKNFETEVLQAQHTILLDFYAPWCMPCQSVGPLIEQLAAEHSNICIGKIDVDHEPTLTQKFEVQSIPTFIVFRNGQPAQRA